MRVADPLMKAFVQFRADDTGLRQDAQAKVKTATEGLGAKVKVELDQTRLDRQRTELQAKLKALGGQAATIRASLKVDDKEGLAKVAAWQAKLAALDKRVVSARFKLDGVAAAEAQILGLDAAMDRAGKNTGNFGVSSARAGQGLGTLATAAIAFGPAVIPALAAATAGMTGFGGIIASTGATLGLFGAAAASHYKQMAAELKKVEAANLAANKAGASPAVIANAKALTAAFQKDYGVLADAQERMQGAWKKFTSQPVINTVLAKGLNLIADIIPKLQPLFDVGAAAATRFLTAIQGWVKSGGLDRAIAGLSALAVKVGPFLETTLRNLASLAGSAAPLFATFAVSVARGMANITGSMASWASGGGGQAAFARFVQYVRDNGPAVVSALAALAGAAVSIARALAPLAPVSLAIAAALARLISAMPPAVIQALAVGFVAYSLAARAAAVSTALFGAQGTIWAIKALAIKAATTAWTAAQWLLNAALTANPIGLVIVALAALGVALYLAWTRSATFRKIVIAAWDGIKAAAAAVIGWFTKTFVPFFTVTIPAAFAAVLTWVRAHWPLILGIVTGPVGLAVSYIATHWGQVTGIFSRSWQWVNSNVLGPMRTMFTQTLPGWFRTAVNGIGAAWRAIQQIVRAPVQFVVNVVLGGLAGAFNTITGALGLPLKIHVPKMATGGPVRDGTGETADDVLVRVSRNETIVSAAHSRVLAPVFGAVGVPGYAAGGIPNPIGIVQKVAGALAGTIGGKTNVGDVIDLVQIAKGLGGFVSKGTGGAAGIMKDVLTAIPKKILAGMLDWFTAHANAGGAEIVNYAMQFLGKIPYVWGGTSLSSAGADCSGFTQSVYGHFGIGAPRTSEAQGSWVTRGPPQPGGLAFYHSPGGGPDPGHVAIVRDPSSVISQGGGMGPRVESLHVLPLLWTGVPPGGLLKNTGAAGVPAGVSGASVAAEQAYAFGLFPGYGWGPGQRQPLVSLWNQESNWNPWAVNPSSGAYGIPQALGHGHPYALGDWVHQILWGLNYIQGRYGSPAAAWGHEVASNWYAGGTSSAAPGLAVVGERGPELVRFRGGEQVIPGYAAGGFIGGNLGQQGSSYLKAWQTRHGGGFGAAWAPVVLNQQIAAMTAAITRAITLSKAGGLSAAQHKHWAYVAADEKKRLATLNHELDVERKWRTALTTSDNQLNTWISAAGTTPSLRRNVTSWKAQLARQKTAITGISKMLGYSDAWLKAHPPPPAANATIKHTYGGDVANNLGAVLAAALGPFTGTATVMDNGGWAPPGLSHIWNGTGRPEPVGGGGAVQLEVRGGGSEFDQFMAKMIKKYVKVAGGGDVQRAYGAR